MNKLPSIKSSWPADSVERRPVKDLLPYTKNARTHSAEQVTQIAHSITEFGWTIPILIDEAGTLIAGHGRILAAKLLGIADVPCMVAAGWSDAQRRAYVIADNKLTLNGGWDNDLLKQELGELGALGFDTSLLGFGTDELNKLFADIGKTDADPDEVPQSPVKPVTKLGDVWLLGNHRIICGDCTDRATVDVLLAGNKPDLCLTDPPYGVGDTVSTKNNYDQYDDSVEALDLLVAAFLPIAREVAKTVVLTPGNKNQYRYPRPTWTMAWFSPSNTGRTPWGFSTWQPVLCYGKDPKLANGKGSHPDSLVQSEIPEKNGHPCPKPVGVWNWFMERSSIDGAIVYEPFSGSGTTIISGEMTGRKVLAIEISPAYVDIAVTRWQTYSGKTAILEETGYTFEETQANRLRERAA